MSRKSEIAPKIQILSNRIRCAVCNADSDEAIFIIDEDLRFRSTVFRPTLSTPTFIRGNPMKMRINRAQSLVGGKNLMRICLRCGHSRKTSIPNN
jgi:hypothetical protein